MDTTINRRSILKAAAGLSCLTALGVPREVLAQASASGQLTVAFPTDVPTWDPNARALGAVQSLYKMVFDQPLDQAPDLSVKPNLVTKWGYVDDHSLSLGLDFRTDATFHDGSPVTAADFRYSFFERPRAPVPEGGRKLDTTFLWRRVKDIEVQGANRAIMHFTEPMPSVIPWLHFLCSYVVPKSVLESVGTDAFTRKPVGSGPYKLVEYQQGGRMVFEAHDRYHGGRPAIGRVTVELVRDPTARVAALEGRRVDVSVDVPIREAQRLASIPGLVSRIDPIADIMLLQITRNGGFADDRVRLAAHHAIDKEVLSKALFGGAAPAISVPAARNTAGYPADYAFAYSPEKSLALLRELNFGPQNPISIKFSSPNGAFPQDFEMARALVQMWKKVGINAELEAIELSTYQERLRAGTLPEATLFSWANAAGDPEMYGGYLLDPKSIFSAFKSDDLGEKIRPLLSETNQDKRMAGYRDAHRFAVEHGYSIPLLQTVKTVAFRKGVEVTKYDTGWVLPQTFKFDA